MRKTSDKRHLFVCGCARSGTTVLQHLLASHPAIVLGAERFITCGFPIHGEGLGPQLFTKERFFEMRPGDTFYKDFSGRESYYEEQRQKFDRASWVGDKSPPFVHLLDRIEEQFADAHVIVIVRDVLDVASSFQVRANNDADTTWAAHRDYALAVKQWNDANRLTLTFQEKADRRTGLTILAYHDLFGREAFIDDLFVQLGLNCPRRVRTAYRAALRTNGELTTRRKSVLTDEQVNYVRANADFGLVEQLMEYRLRMDVPRHRMYLKRINRFARRLYFKVRSSHSGPMIASGSAPIAASSASASGSSA